MAKALKYKENLRRSPIPKKPLPALGGATGAMFWPHALKPRLRGNA
jgi:hypothetical protein